MSASGKFTFEALQFGTLVPWMGSFSSMGHVLFCAFCFELIFALAGGEPVE
jgi:hypothetical protein